MNDNVTDALLALLAGDVPVLLWGPPGTGKTASILSLARSRGAHVEVLIGSQIDAVDVGGLPVPDASGTVQLSAPPWARRLRRVLDEGLEAWLVLDELSCAPPAVQAALLRVVQDRVAADVDLSGIRILAASNPADTSADHGALSAASASRWAHLDWSVVPSTWAAGLVAGWGTPWPAPRAAVAASVSAWIQRSPGALLDVPTGDRAGRAWPSPRSWHALVRAVGYVGLTSPAALTVASACVGDAAALEWLTWARAQDLPDPEDVLAGRAPWPKRGDQLIACSLSVVAAALAPHAEREARVVRAGERLAELRPDQALPAAQAIATAIDDLPEALVGLGEAITATRRRM